MSATIVPLSPPPGDSDLVKFRREMDSAIMAAFALPAHLAGGLMSQKHAEEQGLLADIVANPKDDGFRLIFADWCEDNGQPDRARVIRNERSMSVTSFQRWFSTPTLMEYCGRRSFMAEPAIPLGRIGSFTESVSGGLVVGFFIADWSFGVRNGFPWLARLPLADWLAHGKALVKEFPLIRVELSGPRPAGSLPGWLRATGSDPHTFYPCVIHDAIWGKLQGEMIYESLPGMWWSDYHSVPDALDALSDACLVWARG